MQSRPNPKQRRRHLEDDVRQSMDGDLEAISSFLTARLRKICGCRPEMHCWRVPPLESCWRRSDSGPYGLGVQGRERDRCNMKVRTHLDSHQVPSHENMRTMPVLSGLASNAIQIWGTSCVCLELVQWLRVRLPLLRS